MKIGIVLSNPPAYSETFFVSKIRGLQKSGFEVLLFVDKGLAEFNLCKVYVANNIYKRNIILRVFKLAFVFFKLIWYPKRILKFIQLEKISKRSNIQVLKNIYLNAHILTKDLDWIHFGYATLALGKENVAKSMNAKMAVSFRGYDINVYPLKNKKCYDLVWKRVDKIHSISKYLIARAVRFGFQEDTRVFVITPAVDIEALPKTIFKVSVKWKFVTIARFNWIKGLSTAIQAMNILKNNGIVFEYHIIGTGSEDEKERVKFQVTQLDLENEIIFHEEVSHQATLELLTADSIYIQPSLSEGFCNAVLEAQALGLLCVVSNGGALKENIIEGKTGWSFPRGNSNELAILIQELSKMTVEEKEVISAYSKKRILDNFSIDKQINQFVEFYKR